MFVEMIELFMMAYVGLVQQLVCLYFRVIHFLFSAAPALEPSSSLRVLYPLKPAWILTAARSASSASSRGLF